MDVYVPFSRDKKWIIIRLMNIKKKSDLLVFLLEDSHENPN